MILTGLLLAILIAGGIFLSPSKPAPEPAKVVATTIPIGGAFTLVGPTGETVTEQNFTATKKLVFFGFTHCPSICPTELLKIADILKALGDDAKKVTPLFITVDPERDTPKAMAAFTKNFDDRIVGLTGTQAQIDAVVSEFKAYASRVPQDQDYTMDHSTFLYLTDEANHMVTLYRMDDTADMIVKDLQPRL